MSDKPHLSIAVCGHVDSGKSTTTGRLLFELGGIPDREMEKLRAEAAAQNKSSFAFAFYMDRCKEERERGVTIQCTLKEFFTDKWHYTIIDAPGHRDFIKNMITGASQADVALLLVPADGNFTTAIARGDHKAGQIQGQTRQHARLLNLLGVKQLIIGVNKMDTDTAKYSKERFDEIVAEMKLTLVRVGWKKDFVEKCTPILPLSGWMGDNLITKSDKMTWFPGCDVVTQDGSKVHIDTLKEALNDYVQQPARVTDKPMRMPVSGLYNIKGIGSIITGRIEQGTVNSGDEVFFLPTHTAANKCPGKVFSIEMHHKSVKQASPGDNVGLNVKNLNKDNMPRTGDVMILQKDTTLKVCKEFTATVQILDVPNEIKTKYCPTIFVRTGHSSCRLSKIDWKIGKETLGKKAEEPHSVKSNEMAQVHFEPIQPLVVDTFHNCEGLSRLAVMEGNGVVMLGKCTEIVEADVDAKKK
jgi:elongation factor 1-alpha